MGLDMYLNAKRYLSQYEASEKAMSDAVAAIIKPNFGQVKYVEVEAAYWRKANAIHQWFVSQCQDGVDECQTTYVGKEKLQELLDEVKAVLAAKDKGTALEKLPPQAGFFFGSTEVDDYYWQDMEETKEMLTKILEAPDVDEWSFYYQSSW